MFSAGVLIAVVVGLAAVAAAVLYYGKLLQLRDDAADRPSAPQQSEQPARHRAPAEPLVPSAEFEAVEISESDRPGGSGDGSSEMVLGRYASKAMAILRVEATRQRHRRNETADHLWFYVRHVPTGRPVWFADGIGTSRSEVEHTELRVPHAGF